MKTWEASTPGGERCAVSVYRSLVRVLAAFLLAGCVCLPLEAAQLKIAIVAFDAVNQPAKAGGWGAFRGGNADHRGGEHRRLRGCRTPHA